MTSNPAVDILKKAILLETRGNAFYSQVAATTKSAAVREFFEQMAAEEKTHIKFLQQHFQKLKESGQFDSADLPASPSNEENDTVLSERIQSQISGAGYESAAISAAIALEKGAVDFYGQRADASSDPQEKKLYAWLRDWENGHVRMLMEIDRHLMESIWNDQSFAPF